MRRDEAQRRNQTLEEFNTWSETHPQGDSFCDEQLAKLGQTQDNFILDARLGWFFIPDSIKVYLDVSIEEAAKRRLADINTPGRAETIVHTLEQIKEHIKKRVESDTTRYKKLYGVSAYDPTKFDIAIDTTEMSPQQVVDAVIGAITKMGIDLPPLNKETN
jgi:cytidylate kinase